MSEPEIITILEVCTSLADARDEQDRQVAILRKFRRNGEYGVLVKKIGNTWSVFLVRR